MGRRRWSASVIPTVGLVAAALAATWSFAHLIPVTVRSAEELRDVAFGWPIPWYHQDLGRYDFATYPTAVQIVGDRADPVPTTVDWIALSGDVLPTALALWAVVATLIHLFAPALRRKLATKDAHRGQP